MDSEIMKQVGGSCFCMVYRQFILLLSLLQEVKKSSVDIDNDC